MGKSKYYVVWSGKVPGIYTSWAACEAQVKGIKGASYKSYKSKTEAELAYQNGGDTSSTFSNDIIQNSIAVDAACSGNPGVLEYRGVYVATGEELFRKQPIPIGTNNIGEFLAIVHALALLKQDASEIPIYTDSETALAWIKKKKVKTTLPRDESTEDLFQLIDRACQWLTDHSYTNTIIKWKTEVWGEIPADFGRK